MRAVVRPAWRPGRDHPHGLPFLDGPGRLDYIKLPTISKFSNGAYCSGSLAVSVESLMAIREDMIFNTVKRFKADLVLVDKAPAGIRGELLRSLKFLKSEYPKTKLVLGVCRNIGSKILFPDKSGIQNLPPLTICVGSGRQPDPYLLTRVQRIPAPE